MPDVVPTLTSNHARIKVPGQVTSKTRPEGGAGRRRTRLYVEDRRRPRTRYGEVSWAGTRVVLKVGGSLSRRPRALRRLMSVLAKLARARTLVVVPGGGGFAEEVRRADRRFALRDSPAHWMAILAMDQYAHVLARLAGDAVVLRGREAIAAGRLNVLALSAWLGRADPLPHSWQVTSDSIAAWVARQLRAKMLVLVKDVDGLFDRNPKQGRGARLRGRIVLEGLDGVVDPHFARVLDSAMPCWIVNGTRPERVAELIETGRTYGTEVVSSLRRPARGRAPRRAAGSPGHGRGRPHRPRRAPR